MRSNEDPEQPKINKLKKNQNTLPTTFQKHLDGLREMYNNGLKSRHRGPWEGDGGGMEVFRHKTIDNNNAYGNFSSSKSRGIVKQIMIYILIKSNG